MTQTRHSLRALITTFLVFGAPTVCAAAPPLPGTEDYEILMPFAQWVESQHDSQDQWCCSISDGRIVEVRQVDGHWQVHVTPEKFPGSWDAWETVPDEKVLKGENPIGLPVAWVLRNHIYCFMPPSGV